MKKKQLIIIPNAGLGNRMRVIASCAEVAKQSGREIVMVWPKNAALNCDIQDIFESIGIDYRLPSKLSYLFLSNVYRHGAVQKLSRFYKSITGFFSVTSVFDEDTLGEKELELDKADKTLIVATCFAFGKQQDYSSFKFSKALEQRTQEEYEKIGQPYIGVHIRQTDHVDLMKQSPLSSYIKQIEDCILTNPNQRFYLAVDNEYTKKMITEKYPGHFFVYDHEVSRTSLEGIQSAVVELLLLSRSEQIICSSMSSFSDTAILIGGIKKVINV